MHLQIVLACLFLSAILNAMRNAQNQEKREKCLPVFQIDRWMDYKCEPSAADRKDSFSSLFWLDNLNLCFKNKQISHSLKIFTFHSNQITFSLEIFAKLFVFLELRFSNFLFSYWCILNIGFARGLVESRATRKFHWFFFFDFLFSLFLFSLFCFSFRVVFALVVCVNSILLEETVCLRVVIFRSWLILIQIIEGKSLDVSQKLSNY